MPTLQRRADGGYYIHHFYRDHHTWQILGAGVRYLERRGITEGGRFATDLFMELWLRRLVYHGENIPTGIDEALHDNAVEASVRARVKRFHEMLYPGRADDALPFLLSPEPGAVEQFCQDAVWHQSAPWKIADMVLYPVPAEHQSAFHGARRFAKVALRITTQGGCSREVTEYWFDVGNQWYVLWEVCR